MDTHDLLEAKYEAHRLADEAIVAHYSSSNELGRQWHIREVHRHFLKIADALGYDVQLRSAENTTDEAA